MAAIALGLYSAINIRSELPPIDNVSQILDDWTHPFFTDIKVLNYFGDNTCPDNYEPMFEKYWPGLIDACDCNKAENSENPNLVRKQETF